MDLFDAMKERYSYRGAYKNIQIPREKLKKILEAGLSAPSGCNKQTTSFIGLDDQKLIGSILSLLNKNSSSGGPAAGICVLTQRIPGYADVYFNVQDYAAAIENILLAAAALGCASCWIEGEITADPKTQKQIAELLNIPDEYTVVAFLPLGVPENTGKRPAYKSFSQRAWINAYGKGE